MLYAVTHRTSYRYTSAVSVAQLLGHLRPRQTARQQVLDFALGVEPAPAVATERSDYYGNHSMFIAVEQSHHELLATARSRVRVQPPPACSETPSPPWESVVEECARDIFTPSSATGEYLFNSPHVSRQPEFADYARRFFAAGRPLRDAVADLTAGIHRDFSFDPRATTIATPVSEVFRKRRGVCQDFAHLAIASLRSLGLPARYVSGYLETLPPPGRARLVGADASHAWFSTWCPAAGWMDADPTNNLWVADRHITVAWGRDYSDVSPLRGILLGGGRQRLRVGIDVQRLREIEVNSSSDGAALPR